ncbi:class I SAM-dependent methyltransferase [Agrobacterium rhizogenes]|uniref:class I SAM-dependent methyltransferase n=1 Tax=Rhizobium rhizogenes TaxID=359 RepID=UPI0015730E24|nr:class I SAM-dependent methyltransferase [Rhizobium rhizogenes]NTG87698.1 class I SAM-dependent methyltransferase [Rhizobium rhizogenes]
MLTIEKSSNDCDPIELYGRLRLAPQATEWSKSTSVEAKIHRIHAYPAKFPAFLVSAAFDYAKAEGLNISRVADVFCGCGTVGYEATDRNFDFWGCDINPVATMIARVKALRLDPDRFDRHVASIIGRFSTTSATPMISDDAIGRLAPWYNAEQFEDLARLANAIELEGEATDEYRMALRCAFSAIVKSASRWKSRSVKPAKDFERVPPQVIHAFERQCSFMSAAWSQLHPDREKIPEVVQGNITLVDGPSRPVDLIVTSPPYVTSYEYADLHQLSALWLGFADDHRTMRAGIIGTGHRRANLARSLGDMNPVATRIVFSLFDRNRPLAEAVAAYFLDMQIVANRCYEFLRPGGIAIFVIGNTKLHDVTIDNANHLVESLLNVGFHKIRAVRRSTMNKPNTPFRMADGKFSNSPNAMHIYGDEYILMAHR